MYKINIRMAEPEDAPALARLADQSGNSFVGFSLDWSAPGVDHSWLCAVDENGWMLGALQVLMGQPAGRIEMLMLASDLGQTLRAHVTVSLSDQATNLLRRAGCQVATTMISIELSGFVETAEDRGWVVTGTAHTLTKRLV